ncbi:V-type ATPase assembly factor pkr1 [Ceratocystis platani]|uniref:V-type ATPase assembly factor pkr1 n=1 Tax=Ceratocystis fimbriata f. sp. platani TaxID=88771 RepID=A0A0F8DGX8_CERFI|nr:V-type ATPase assembly factor pkr1 [Ceratocystis platani]
MASFVVELWESIFTPGPTPVLLKATNATFAALQLLLLLLLLSTYSIHFVALSIISGGLWWAINWFAAELAVHQAQEDAKLKQQQQHQEHRRSSGLPDEPSANNTQPPPSDADDDTEVDEATPALVRVETPISTPPATFVPKEDKAPPLVLIGQTQDADKPTLNSRNVEPAPMTGELKQRLDTSGNHSSASTEDEWERVSEYEKDK